VASRLDSEQGWYGISRKVANSSLDTMPSMSARQYEPLIDHETMDGRLMKWKLGKSRRESGDKSHVVERSA